MARRSSALIASSVRRAASRSRAVAVRSSATAEDLPEASFAGQRDVPQRARRSGAARRLRALLRVAVHRSRDQLPRASSGFDHTQVALSVGVQPMVRSDRGAAGVMFSLDTETGFPDVVVIDAQPGASARPSSRAASIPTSTACSSRCSPTSELTPDHRAHARARRQQKLVYAHARREPRRGS